MEAQESGAAGAAAKEEQEKVMNGLIEEMRLLRVRKFDM